MNKHPLWLLGVLFGMLGSFIMIFILCNELDPSKINLPMILITGALGYVLIGIYSFFQINKDLNQKFETLNDRDKLLDLLEDQFGLEKNANYCVYRARKNMEKIKKLFPAKTTMEFQ
jgi:hypothetical protein